MYPRFAFALLFSVCAFGLGIAIPAFPEQKCGANAVFMTCGSACVPDCANPEAPKLCTLQCVMDCFCKEGFLKNAKGECVRPQECEARTQETAMELEIPQCPNNEEFQACGSACAPTCANPHPSPVCTKNCVIGCFCKPGFLRTKLGLCVPANQCEAPETSLDLEVPQCPNNEEFQACGSACAPTCANPHPSPVCTKNCVIGCFCKPGYLRTKLGLCVPANQCEAPQTAAFFAYPPEVSQCKENEVFMPCGSACAPTCANPHPGPVCTMQCVVGCFCKPGYLKNEHGVCVPSETCGVPAAEAMPLPPQMCGDNEEFRQCKGCDGTCENPNPICPRICIPGCACKQGHFRNGPNGKCVLAQQCPPMPVVMVMPLPPQVCGENEEFRQCKGCDGTCENPNPLCPRNCIPGCACKQGHLRSGSNGKCIMAQQCPQVDPVPATSFMMMPPVPKCGANEEFHSCGTACPATCANPHPSPVCTRQCVIGCFCKEGFLKNAQGVCVPAANCEAPQAMMASPVQPAGQCSSDREMFSECGEQLDCLASCNTPLPFLIHGEPQLPKKCLERKCTPGCVCQKPYVRHADGRCVEVNQCQHDSPFTTPSH